MHLGRQAKVPFPETYKGFRLIRTHGRVFGIPPAADPDRVLAAELLFTHPAVLSATTLDEMRERIDTYDKHQDRPAVVGHRDGYEIVQFREAFHAVPQSAGGIDLDLRDDRTRAGVLSATSRAELEGAIRRQAEAAPVEFAGWLPIFEFSGNCGAHPQFAHTGDPPPGYRFTRSATQKPLRSRSADARAKFRERVGKALGTAWAVARIPFAFVRPRRGIGLTARARVFVAMLRLALLLFARGCNPLAVLRFLQSRHLHSQLLTGDRRDLVFLTSMPYTYGQNPWVIEIEDPTTLFYPLVQNGHTCNLALTESPYFPVVKALLEADHCRAILTHMKSTAELVATLFDSEVIRRKVLYTPLGVRLPARWQRHDPHPADEPIDLLFINSWCQVPENFFVRGGLDILEAFAILHQRYPQLRLTMRTALPALSDHHQRIIESGWVRVINRFLSAEEMAALHAESHVFLLPAARVHIVSLLQAMSYGLAVVGSDGWGMEEYLDHERNGLVVRGRYGKVSWADREAGMLRENYEPMYTADPGMVAGLVEAVSRLVEDRALRRRLGRTARADVETRFNLGQWNRGLKAAFDRGTGVGSRVPVPGREIDPAAVTDFAAGPSAAVGTVAENLARPTYLSGPARPARSA